MTRDSRAARPLRRRTLAALIAIALVTVAITAPRAVSLNVVISQVYGGGGNAGAQYRNDFVELFNRGTTPVSLNGWSIQYTSATGTGNFSTNLTPLVGTLAPGQYYLIQLAVGANLSAPLPLPDATGTTAMSATGGKVVLVNTSTGLACNGGSAPCDATQLGQIVDLVGWDGANFFESRPGARDEQHHRRDPRRRWLHRHRQQQPLTLSCGAPAPRNTASPVAPCLLDLPPSLTSIGAGQAARRASP